MLTTFYLRGPEGTFNTKVLKTKNNSDQKTIELENDRLGLSQLSVDFGIDSLSKSMWLNTITHCPILKYAANPIVVCTDTLTIINRNNLPEFALPAQQTRALSFMQVLSPYNTKRSQLVRIQNFATWFSADLHNQEVRENFPILLRNIWSQFPDMLFVAGYCGEAEGQDRFSYNINEVETLV